MCLHTRLPSCHNIKVTLTTVKGRAKSIGNSNGRGVLSACVQSLRRALTVSYKVLKTIATLA